MLEFSRLIFRNFGPYGDYDTIIDFEGLGPCLIVGEINELATDPENQEELSPELANLPPESNGAGKSTLVNAIGWVLFGRTPRNPKPGDKVMNWVTKKDCYAELLFKNGDRLIRTRKGTDGKDELKLIRGGQDISLGTGDMQQNALNKELNLDWTLFRGSTFFSQFGTSWLEMSDPLRRQALEREFRLDRVQHYAAVAKEKKSELESQQDKIRNEINSNQANITTLTAEINRLRQSAASFEEQKAARLAAARQTLDKLVVERDTIVVPSLDETQAAWDKFKASQKLVDAKKQELYSLEKTQRELQTDLQGQNRLIAAWTAKGGKICTTCEQPITEEHIHGKLESPTARKAELEAQLAEIGPKVTKYQQVINLAERKIESLRPGTTLEEIKRQQREANDKIARFSKLVADQQRTVERIEGETNQFETSISSLEARCLQHQQAIDELTVKLRALDKLVAHVHYVYRVYSDRRKLKGCILKKRIPYLNERITYYLEKLGTDLRVEFTDGLGLQSNLWSPDLFSGGESKKVDLAIMMAMFDLHKVMYGRFCNVLVLDEVDGRMSERSSHIFAEVLQAEYTGKVDAILIISHRANMRGAFPAEIRVVRENRFSRVAEIVK